jgi:PD-(D/E)XK nuclease superfamily
MIEVEFRDRTAQIPLVGGRPVIRRSLAEALLTCSRHVREDSERMAFGQAVHEFIRAYFLRCHEMREESLQDLVIEIAEAAWNSIDGLRQDRWEEFMFTCEEFARNHEAELDTLMLVEKALVVDAGWALFTCQVDRVDRIDDGDPDDPPTKLRLRDYKTEWRMGSHVFQIYWYVYTLFLTYRWVREITVEIDLVRSDSSRSKPLVFHRGELDLWWQYRMAKLRPLVESILAGTNTAPPVGGPACDGCQIRYHCARSLAPAALMPTNDEQARALFADHLRLKEGAQAAKNALEQYQDGKEPLIGHGFRFGHQTPQSLGVRAVADVAAVIKWAKRKRLALDELLSVRLPTRKAEREAMVEAGLIVRELGESSWKATKYVGDPSDIEAAMAQWRLDERGKREAASAAGDDS